MHKAAESDAINPEDLSYARAQMREWDEWQARRRAKRLGGDWKDHRRYGEPKRMGGTPDRTMVKCQCKKCGKQMERMAFSLDASCKKHGGAMCRPCVVEKAAKGIRASCRKKQAGG